MINAVSNLLERYFNLPHDRAVVLFYRVVVSLAALVFVLMATLIVAFEDVFPGQTSVESLKVGDRAAEDILAPKSWQYVSPVLTAQSREAAVANVRPSYDQPDPSVSRQQTELARQILDFIADVRRDAFSANEQKMQDIQHITALVLNELTVAYILEIDNERWQEVGTEIVSVLERVMRGEIKDSDLDRIRDQLLVQVSTRFDERESVVIASIISDLVRANTSIDEEETAAERERVAATITDVTRSFLAGQVVIPAGKQVTEADYEALDLLGLLLVSDTRFQDVVQALLANTVVMVLIGLHIARFRPVLYYGETRVLILIACVFLVTLIGARFNGLDRQIYLYPTAALALVFVVIDGPQVAIIGVVGLGLIMGLMANNSLEVTTLVTVGGIIGTLTLRRAERLNSFFFAGVMVAVSNVAVAALFNLGTPDAQDAAKLLTLVGYSLINGVLTATVALAGMYIVTLAFNLPTALKLVELSQPSQPMMQRLLREAPGTYQHSLQVANLSEQAANAIGANAELTRVAALYHDIGKTLNPGFFTENQRGMGNPHDVLNDPYRSADIIISHITGGDELARQNRLPARIRDFILEHHGTSQVYVFYKQAIILAGDDESLVNIADFTYPGPRPQTRETGLMMLADSCEAAVRSREPKNKEEIEEIVRQVINGKREAGQLNESNLTLNDIHKIQTIFIDMLQAIRHPRINYVEAVDKARKGSDEVSKKASPTPVESTKKRSAEVSEDGKSKPETKPSIPTGKTSARKATGEHRVVSKDDDAPLAEVPRLRRTAETKAQTTTANGGGETQKDETVASEPESEKDSTGE
jgi:cyclic-di-AMP phosphodiesterase PgpH